MTMLANRGAVESQAFLSAALLVPAFVLMVVRTIPYVGGGLANAWGATALSLWSLVITAVIDAYFLVVVAVFSRTARRRRGAVLAAACGMAVDLLAWVAYVLVLSGELARYVDIALSTLTLTLFTVAWGIARRRNRGWVGGLILTVPVAAALMWLSYQPWAAVGAWTQYAAWWIGAFVVCCLICWIVDTAASRAHDDAASRAHDEAASGAVEAAASPPHPHGSAAMLHDR